jgi:hypothetical protein
MTSGWSIGSNFSNFNLAGLISLMTSKLLLSADLSTSTKEPVLEIS